MGGGGAPSSRFKLPDNLVFYKIFTSPFHNSYCLLSNEIISSEYPMYLNSVEGDITKKNQGKSCEELALSLFTFLSTQEDERKCELNALLE